MIDLTGKKFTRLHVVKQLGKDGGGNIAWLCLCDCGRTKSVLGRNLKSGATKSCGCLQKQKVINKLTKHGQSPGHNSSKIYRVWTSMFQRCTNPNNGGYNDYGGRGISVCVRWFVFENFFLDMGAVPLGHSIDRIDNNKGYCKENCRWATRKQQMRNMRRNRLISFNGKTQCLSAWAEELNISSTALAYRLRNPSWSREKALTFCKK